MENPYRPIVLFTHFGYEVSYDGRVDPVCNSVANTIWSQLFFLGSIFFLFVLPFLILVILYSIIVKNLMMSPGIVPVGRQENSTAALRYRKQVVFMIFTVVVFFFMCILPFRALVVWIIVAPHEDIASLGNEGYYPLLYFCRVMFHVNSAVNPILYNIMSSKFRSGFLKLCGLKKNCFRKHTRALLRNSTFNTSTLTALTTSSIHRASIFETLSRSKANSFSKNSTSSQQNSLKKLINKETLKCHFKLKTSSIITRRRSFTDYLHARARISTQLKRSFSADSFFRTEFKICTVIPVKSSIKFVNRNETSISSSLVNGVTQGHSILKKSNTRKMTSVVVKRQISKEEEVYDYQLIPTCTYVINKRDLKESFV